MEGRAPRESRAWWLLIVGMILPTVTTYIYFFLLDDRPEVVQKLGMTLCKVAQFGLPVVWVLFVRSKPLQLKGISIDGMAIGVAFGLVTLVVALALYHGWLKHTEIIQAAAQQVIGRVAGLGFKSPLAFIGLGVFYVLWHSLLEEYYWRWFIFGMLRERTSLTTAILVSSLAFMSHHVLVLAKFFGWASIGTLFFSLCVAVGGAFWAWLYNKTGRLYAPWFSHAMVDAAIFIIGFSMLTSGS